VLIVDHAKGTKQEISEITAKLDNVSLDRPISLLFSAKIDQIPLSLKGEIGPVGEDLNKGNIPVNLTLMALEQLEVKINGQLIDMGNNPRFDLKISSNSFSPKKLVKSLNKESEIQTADADVLNKLSFETVLTGTPEAIDLTKGSMTLDDSKINFECRIKAFEKPDIRFRAELDKIDVDRYLPPKQTGAAGEEPPQKESPSVKSAGLSEKIDYKPLRSLVLNGNLKAGDIKINSTRITNLSMKITGNKGIFKINPLTFAGG
jgi:AsmA protein